MSMRDCRGRDTYIGDDIVMVVRAGNVAQFRFGTVCDMDEKALKFKIRNPDGSLSSLMNWYFYEIEHSDYCKVLNLEPED